VATAWPGSGSRSGMSIVSDAASDGLMLVAAGSGPDVNGWLFAIDKAATTAPVVEELDHLNSSGMVALDDRVYRVLSSPSEPNASGDFIVYDASGVIVYRRVDGLADSHGLVWDGTNFIVPCSFTNEIFWLSPAGETVRVWRAPGEGDAWHINGLNVRDGRLYASAFGKFATHRGWSKTMGERSGIIFDVETQEPVVSDLACPHDPYFLDGGWLVCDSFTKRLLLIDAETGAVRRQVQLPGWTRGLAVGRDHLFVGVSGQRHSTTSKGRAGVHVLDRSTLATVAGIELPCEEISALALVPNALIAGLRRGFRTNDMRVAVQDRRDLFELAGQGAATLKMTPMPALARPRDFRVRIRVRAPRRVRAGEFFDAVVTIKNRSRRTLFTAAPFPVNIGIVFEQIGGTGQPEEVRREPLPEPLLPGKTLRFTLSVQSPAAAAAYRVRFTLLQEWVRWFDTDQRWFARLRSSNRCRIPLRVSAAEAGPVRASAPLDGGGLSAAPKQEVPK
jgi:acetolactate synthase-1/2/3 large subunit